MLASFGSSSSNYGIVSQETDALQSTLLVKDHIQQTGFPLSVKLIRMRMMIMCAACY